MSFEEIEKDMMVRYSSYDKLKKKLEEADKTITLLNNAMVKFKLDKNYDELILVYESIFLNAKKREIANFSYKYYFVLANCYIEKNQIDKAWGYLNMLLINKTNFTDNILKLQSKISKKEGKFIYSLELLSRSYFYKVSKGLLFNENLFRKESSQLIKKANLDSSIIDKIVCLIMKKHSDESYFVDEFRQIVQ